jgi:hypothetical protein
MPSVNDFSDDMFLTAARFLGLHLWITSDALVGQTPARGNRTDSLENTLEFIRG